jgi:NAD-dependent deacetylase
VATVPGATRDGIEQLAELVRASDSVVALTGAGISVPSGIPDFRSPGTGLWENVDPMEVAHIDAWRRDPRRFWSFYGARFTMLGTKQPNDAHRALVTLERAGRLDAVVTQNIDRLHRRAGTAELVEVHGSVERSVCLACDGEETLEATLRRLDADPEGVPRCDCGAPLKPGVVLFGEWLPEGALERAHQLAAEADLLLCIGSSLEVQPIAQLPSVTRMNGGQVAIVTQGPTPYDRRVAVKRDGDVVAELRALLDALGL